MIQKKKKKKKKKSACGSKDALRAFSGPGWIDRLEDFYKEKIQPLWI